MFSWHKYQKPIIALSPMAGYTDSAFKQVVRSLAPEAILYTEFVSTDAVHFGSKKTKRMMKFDDSEHPVILQVFGNTPERFVETAQMAEKMGYDGVDINMGCPAKKVIRSEHGSALVKIKNRSTALKILDDMVKAIKIPVSVKTRLGWENADDLLDFCKDLEAHGCASIAVHGRTTKQAYSGEADWNPIYELKRHLNIPILGNGDIRTVSDFRKRIQDLDGVLIGRAALGDPWLLRDILDFSQHREKYEAFSDENLDHQYPRAEKIPRDKKKALILKHCELAVQTKGERLGILEMRKQLAFYVKGMSGAKETRGQLVRADMYSEVEKILDQIDL